MGLLDDALKEAVPGGNIAKPAMIALGALLVGRMIGAGGRAAKAPSSQPGITPTEGSPVGGLGGLLDKLQAAGHGDAVKSWVGPGQNAPIAPGQLGSALGQKTVTNLAQQTGVSEQELLMQLAQALPALVDKLTPNGQVPNAKDLAA